MTKSYEQLRADIATLSAKAEAARLKEVAEVIAKIKVAIDFYDITAADLGLRLSGNKAAGSKARAAKRGSKASVGVKFKDTSGNVWGGRGPRPAWLRAALAAGAELQSFAV
jgi:DNA-binding protein H-NS